MERDRWTRGLIILLVIIASLYLFEKVSQFIGFLSEIIVLFSMALLLTFILHPIVDWLGKHPVPHPFIKLLRRRQWNEVANILSGIHLPHGLAVGFVYLGLLVIILAIGILLIPITVQQLSQLGANLPGYIARIPSLTTALEEELSRFNINIDLTSIYRPEELTQRAETIGRTLIQQAVVIVTSVASVVTNVLIVLALSFYIALDGERILQRSMELIPADYYEEVLFSARSISRIFGGLVRGYLIVSVLYALGTMFIMLLAGLSFVLVIGLTAGLMTAIPIVGPPIAVILPAAIALFQKPSLTIWVLLIMIVYQQILLHALLPKIISEAAEVPTLLIIGAMLGGFSLFGFWGFILGIPGAAVIYATAVALLERLRKRRAEALEAGSLEALPPSAAAALPEGKRIKIMSGAEPFHFKRNGPGCLLIHGFTSTPAEMREMGEYLAKRDLTVSGVRLAGHGTTPEDMEKTTWRDWYTSVQEGLMELREECDEIFVMGLSLGGALALYLATQHRVAGVVSMATPATVSDWRLRYVHLMKHLVRFAPKIPEDFHNPTVVAKHLSYDRLPSRCAESLAEFLRRLDEVLPRVEAPALLIHSKHDIAVSPSDMPYIYERINSSDKEMIWLENSGHVVTEDYDKLVVFERAYDFVRQHSQRWIEVDYRPSGADSLAQTIFRRNLKERE